MTATIVHDTRRIIDANAEACALFRCDREDLIDQDLATGAHGQVMQWLFRLRLTTIRERGELPARTFPFDRYTGPAFWATVKTVKVGDDLWITYLNYEREYDDKS